MLSEHIALVLIAVRAGGHEIALTGVTDVYRNQATADRLETLESRRQPAALKISFTHQPSEGLVRFASERNCDLFLAGHMPGGQIAFPLPGLLLTGSRLETRYVSGFYKVGKMLVSVNNGLGLALPPIRYQASAEVTLLTVNCGGAAPSRGLLDKAQPPGSEFKPLKQGIISCPARRELNFE